MVRTILRPSSLQVLGLAGQSKDYLNLKAVKKKSWKRSENLDENNAYNPALFAGGQNSKSKIRHLQIFCSISLRIAVSTNTSAKGLFVFTLYK